MRKGTLITITSPRYTILEDYLTDYRSPFYPASLKKDKNKTGAEQFDWAEYSRQVISWHGETTDTANYRQILNAFATDPEKTEQIANVNPHLVRGYLDMPLKPGIQLYIPFDQVTKEALLNDGIEIVAYSDPAFKASVLAQLEAQQDYIPSTTLQSSDLQSINSKHINFTIWVWCRALSNSTKGPLEGELLNVTPFVTNFSTSNSKDNGGNFRFQLQPIPAKKDPSTGKWIIDPDTTTYNESDDTYITHAHTHLPDLTATGTFAQMRTPFYFNNILSTNDLVFIRKETLVMEEKERLNENKDLNLNTNILADKVYDMIGLIDSVGSNDQYENLDIQTIVTGRDLSKLFIEDGTYFYSMENKQGVLHWHGGASSDNPYMQRIVNTNSYLYLGMYYNNSIEDILRFIIQQLTNIEICPDSVFTSYKTSKTDIQNSETYGVPQQVLDSKDKTNKRWKDDLFKQGADQHKNPTQELSRRLQEQVKAFRTKEFKPDFNHKATDLSKTAHNVTQKLLDFFQDLNATGSFIADEQNQLIGWKAITFEKEAVPANCFPISFAADKGSNYEGLFFLFVDKPRPTIDSVDRALLQTAYEYTKSLQASRHIETKTEFQEDAKGIWQIVKLVIDSKVGHRWLIDSSLSSATGSLLNYLHKVAQKPFVELFMDTYGDQFYITVRQPPTDKEGMHSYLKGRYQNGEESKEGRDTIVTIRDADVVNDLLMYDDKEVYSWYHFVPQGAIIASSSQFSTAHIPAIFFPEYAAIWGAKSLDLVHNYSNYYSQFSSNYKENNKISNLQKQGFYDLKYLIDSHQYLPFTRKGTITIKGGDRRFKIGNPVRLESTGEIFWIDAINDQVTVGESLERVVSLTVSRGMVEKFIFGVKGSELNKRFPNSNVRFTPDKTFSYFDIINTELNLSKTRKAPKYKTVTEEVEEEIVDSGTNADLLDVTTKEEALQAGTFNSNTEREIRRLDARMQPVVRAFFTHLESLGWEVILTSGLRTYAEQMGLWIAAGKKNVARPGTSRHETGLAVDINLIARKQIGNVPKGTHLKLGGKTESGRASHKPLWIAAGIPTIAQKYNLMWGGNYHNYSDNVHFQLAVKPDDLAQLKKEQQPKTQKVIKQKTVQDGYDDVLDESAIFENFKVDEEVFNFFLRKQHLTVN